MEVENPLLEVLVELGGRGKPREIYPLVTKKFPQIREEDLLETLSSGTNKWTNRIQWVRQSLIQKREMSSPSRGIWAITERGRKRIVDNDISETVPRFVDSYEEYESSFRS